MQTGGAGAFVVKIEDTGTAISTQITGLAPITQYSFQVRVVCCLGLQHLSLCVQVAAVNAVGQGAFSLPSEITATLGCGFILVHFNQ